MEKACLAQNIYHRPFSTDPIMLERITYILGAVENFGSNFDTMKKFQNEGQKEK